MGHFKLHNIKRRMFVYYNEQVKISPQELHCTHGEWFDLEGWTNNDKDFIEKHARGYVDDEGVYIYQGRDARLPDLNEAELRKIMSTLCDKLSIAKDKHIYIGTIPGQVDAQGKLKPEKDIGKVNKYC